jgi:hypothetical protein
VSWDIDRATCQPTDCGRCWSGGAPFIIQPSSYNEPPFQPLGPSLYCPIHPAPRLAAFNGSVKTLERDGYFVNRQNFLAKKLPSKTKLRSSSSQSWLTDCLRQRYCLQSLWCAELLIGSDVIKFEHRSTVIDFQPLNERSVTSSVGRQSD